MQVSLTPPFSKTVVKLYPGLHTTLAYRDVNAVKAQVTFLPLPGRLEVLHFDEDSAVFLTYAVCEGKESVKAGVSDEDQTCAGDDLASAGSNLYVVNEQPEKLEVRLEQYLKTTASSFYDAEQSEIMKPTLLMASSLAREKNVSSPQIHHTSPVLLILT